MIIEWYIVSDRAIKDIANYPTLGSCMDLYFTLFGLLGILLQLSIIIMYATPDH